jgi:hypothetical protein
MINIDRFIIITGTLINLILIAGFIFGKKILKCQTSTGFNSRYGVFLAVVFTFYFLSLIALIVTAFTHNLYFFGLILILFFIIPFVVGNLSTFEKANFFVNIQVLTLFLSFFIITSMMGQISSQNIKLSDKNFENIQKPILSNHLMKHHLDALSHFKKSICTLVRPYNHVFKKTVKTKPVQN